MDALTHYKKAEQLLDTQESQAAMTRATAHLLAALVSTLLQGGDEQGPGVGRLTSWHRHLDPDGA